MREIKFRAWDSEKKQMWTDVLSEMGENEYYNNAISMWQIGRAMENGESIPRLEFMQYTGLLDRNSKEIYEGDVIKYMPPCDDEAPLKKDVVSYCDDRCWYEIEDYPLVALEEIEVIGNKFQNPELLENTEQEDK